MLTGRYLVDYPIREMKKPTRYQIGCLYKVKDPDSLCGYQIGRAKSVENDVWTLESYDGSTFTVPASKLRVAKKKQMKEFNIVRTAYA